MDYQKPTNRVQKVLNVQTSPSSEALAKQSPSPYITFCTLKRTEVKTIFPEASFSDMGRILGLLWSAMKEDGRSVSTFQFCII
jgi:hypothetical protein